MVNGGLMVVNGGLIVFNGGLMVSNGDLASGKRLQFANWNITVFKFRRSTISMGHGFKFANCEGYTFWYF
jgi:hypothetical protein